MRPDLRFHVRTIDESYGGTDRYLIAQARVSFQDETRGDWVWPQRWSSEHSGYADLLFTAQIHQHNTGDFYGRKMEYDARKVGLAAAEEMLKTLRRIDRGLVKLDERLGYATDYVSWLARIATVIGMPAVRCFGRHSDINPGYHWMDANGLTFWLSQQVSAWRTRYGLTAVAA